MAVSDSFYTFVLDQLSAIIPVRGRRMFGGFGLYAGDRFFAVIDDDALYFKVDDVSRPAFEAAGMQPWQVSRGYYGIPATALEDSDELRPWLDHALAAAERKRDAPTARRKRK